MTHTESTGAQCFRCNQNMQHAEGCTDDRIIMFADGETAEPIPHGEETHTRTYAEMVASFKSDIDSGGRGTLSVAAVREDLERFTEAWDEAEFNTRDCHDCGAAVGAYHHPGCDSEECPRCGDQYFICDCDTPEKRELWGSA